MWREWCHPSPTEIPPQGPYMFLYMSLIFDIRVLTNCTLNDIVPCKDQQAQQMK
jgi:hypothetical protein